MKWGDGMKTKLFAAKDCIKRNFGKIIKTIWLIILLCICAFYIKVNYSRMVTGMIQLDYIVVLLSIVLVLMPLVSEIDLWGLKVKREIQRVEKELNREIIYLHKQMMNVETNNSQNINFGYLPTKEELLDNGKNDDSASLNLEMEKENEKILFFLQTRIALEKEISRIIAPVTITKGGVLSGLPILVSYQLINREELKRIKTIYSICNRAIHGEIVSDDYYNFVKDNGSDILNKLKKMNSPDACE